MGLDQVELKRNAKNIIQAIKEDNRLAWYGELIEDAKAQFKDSPFWGLHFPHREWNQATRVMTKAVFDIQSHLNPSQLVLYMRDEFYI